jgi:HTH-type transcriptional regulator/antitoxin MqsA
MKCPVCGAAELVHDVRDIEYSYSGHATTVSKVTADFCPTCAEIILDPIQADRYGASVRAFIHKVNTVDKIAYANV